MDDPGTLDAVTTKQFEGNVSAAARALGITQPLLSEFLAGSRGAGEADAWLLTGVFVWPPWVRHRRPGGYRIGSYRFCDRETLTPPSQ